MNRVFNKFVLLALTVGLLPKLSFALSQPTFGPGAGQILNIVNEGDLRDHAKPLCSTSSTLTCDIIVCEGLYLDCAFGGENLNGCDQPAQTNPSSTGLIGTIQPLPGEHLCIKNQTAIQETCDAQIESFVSKAKAACEPEQATPDTSAPVAEPMVAAGGCSMVMVKAPLSLFNLAIIFSAVFIPLGLRLKKK